jgi:hypothetical protein
MNKHPHRLKRLMQKSIHINENNGKCNICGGGESMKDYCSWCCYGVCTKCWSDNVPINWYREACGICDHNACNKCYEQCAMCRHFHCNDCAHMEPFDCVPMHPIKWWKDE